MTNHDHVKTYSEDGEVRSKRKPELYLKKLDADAANVQGLLSDREVDADTTLTVQSGESLVVAGDHQAIGTVENHGSMAVI